MNRAELQAACPDMQSLFTFIANHLLQQNAKAMSQEGVGAACFYRGVNCLRCAVGVIIPDEDYVLAMEGLTVRELFVRFPEAKFREFSSAEVELLGFLQSVHDEQLPDQWPTHLKHTAVGFALKFEAPAAA